MREQDSDPLDWFGPDFWSRPLYANPPAASIRAEREARIAKRLATPQPIRCTCTSCRENPDSAKYVEEQYRGISTICEAHFADNSARFTGKSRSVVFATSKTTQSLLDDRPTVKIRRPKLNIDKTDDQVAVAGNAGEILKALEPRIVVQCASFVARRGDFENQRDDIEQYCRLECLKAYQRTGEKNVNYYAATIKTACVAFADRQHRFNTVQTSVDVCGDDPTDTWAEILASCATERERELIDLLSEGRSIIECAPMMNLGKSTLCNMRNAVQARFSAMRPEIKFPASRCRVKESIVGVRR
jgi:hypothetical protein